MNYESFKQMSDENRIRLIASQPIRGRILDRNGNVLADSRVKYSLIIKPQSVNDINWEKHKLILSDLLNVDSNLIEKKYFAITWGSWKEEQGLIDRPIKRAKKDPTVFEVNINGRSATTGYSLSKRGKYLNQVFFFPKTGRTHQIRVHASFVGCPIFCDEKYGGGLKKARGFLPEVTKIFTKIADKGLSISFFNFKKELAQLCFSLIEVKKVFGVDNKTDSAREHKKETNRAKNK